MSRFLSRRIIFLIVVLMFPARILSSQNLKDRDGNSYKTMKFGPQVWMVENLKVSHYRNGDPIPNITKKEQWESARTGAWCFYENNKIHNAELGRLYNWYAVNDHRGLCPKGWHVPTMAEWQTLSDFLGGDGISGGKMKQQGIWKNADSTIVSSGFASLPAGSSNCCGFFYKDLFTYYWSSEESDSIRAPYRFIGITSPEFRKFVMNKTYGYSCRCLQN